MMNILLVIIATLPGLIISYLIYHHDRYDREPRLVLLICFLLGMLITFPAMQLEGFADSQGFGHSDSFIMLLVLSYIVVGFSEEVVKFISLYIYPFHHKAFNEPLDGIVYSVMISMGFATLENILYANRYGIETILFRAFTAVPAHGAFAVIMGYYVGLAKFDQPRRYILLAKGLLFAVLLHGTYDFFILQEYYEWMVIMATFTLCVSLFFAIKLIRVHLRNSPFREVESKEAGTEEKVEVAEGLVEEKKLETPVAVIEDNEILDAVIEDMGDEEE